MIKNWLLKHRWMNELLKLIVAGFFACIGYSLWLIVPVGSGTGDFVVGFSAGLMCAIVLAFVVDICFSIPAVIKALKANRGELT